MSYMSHRENFGKIMQDQSILLCYAGRAPHSNEDDYYNFEVNSNFYYLTGLSREGMVLAMTKYQGVPSETLFIEEPEPLAERWTGKMPTKEEVTRISGVKDVRYLPDLPAYISSNIVRHRTLHAYFDLYRMSLEDQPDTNLQEALKFGKSYPGIELLSLRDALIPLREVKDQEEIDLVKKADAITRQGLERVMRTLKPGMMEYQVQAEFEYTCKKLGAKKFSFNTIAGSGLNGCMMHYDTNDARTQDGKLILLDLGAKYENYCSDITRTYPVNGHYTDRQRAYYDLVLKANLEVAKQAKPGMTLADLNDITKEILGEGLVAMSKIARKEDVGKYYMHGVSHSIGIDCHDADYREDVIRAGWIISDEPGLYVDEEEIGIRIEDDLLVTENGCVVLSQDILKDPDEIEAYMAAHHEETD